MRKLFRFRYEPCNGTCYAYDKVMFRELNALTPVERKALVNIMARAHDKLCDNPEYSFGLDLDEQTEIFVGHFRTPSKLELFSNKDFDLCVVAVAEAVLAEDIPELEGKCVFGSRGEKNLGTEILASCQQYALAA